MATVKLPPRGELINDRYRSAIDQPLQATHIRGFLRSYFGKECHLGAVQEAVLGIDTTETDSEISLREDGMKFSDVPRKRGKTKIRISQRYNTYLNSAIPILNLRIGTIHFAMRSENFRKFKILSYIGTLRYGKKKLHAKLAREAYSLDK